MKRLFTFLRKLPAWMLVTGVILGLAGLFIFKATVTEPTQTYMSREEFRSLILMKTPEEVIRTLGRPGKTTDYGNPDVEQTWWYGPSTYDPISGQIDSYTRIRFEYGYVVGVDF